MVPMQVLIPVGLGELYDKLSVLEIKLERIADQAKIALVRHEYDELKKIAANYPIDPALYAELKEVNDVVWESVSHQWEKTSRGEKDQELAELANIVLVENDRRAEVKRKINTKYGSDIIEVKDYAKPFKEGIGFGEGQNTQ